MMKNFKMIIDYKTKPYFDILKHKSEEAEKLIVGHPFGDTGSRKFEVWLHYIFTSSSVFYAKWFYVIYTPEIMLRNVIS